MTEPKVSEKEFSETMEMLLGDRELQTLLNDYFSEVKKCQPKK